MQIMFKCYSCNVFIQGVARTADAQCDRPLHPSWLHRVWSSSQASRVPGRSPAGASFLWTMMDVTSCNLVLDLGKASVACWGGLGISGQSPFKNIFLWMPSPYDVPPSLKWQDCMSFPWSTSNHITCYWNLQTHSCCSYEKDCDSRI